MRASPSRPPGSKAISDALADQVAQGLSLKHELETDSEHPSVPRPDKAVDQAQVMAQDPFLWAPKGSGCHICTEISCASAQAHHRGCLSAGQLTCLSGLLMFSVLQVFIWLLAHCRFTNYLLCLHTTKSVSPKCCTCLRPRSWPRLGGMFCKSLHLQRKTQHVQYMKCCLAGEPPCLISVSHLNFSVYKKFVILGKGPLPSYCNIGG